jgi:hypothetical protein
VYITSCLQCVPFSLTVYTGWYFRAKTKHRSAAARPDRESTRTEANNASESALDSTKLTFVQLQRNGLGEQAGWASNEVGIISGRAHIVERRE